MEKTVTGLLGATAALAFGSAGANAMPTQPSVMTATSYADLLEPIHNASDVLVADDAARGVQIPGMELVQYNGYAHHHHHHHHHNAYVRRYYRPYVRPKYHHHHHHNAYGDRYKRGY